MGRLQRQTASDQILALSWGSSKIGIYNIFLSDPHTDPGPHFESHWVKATTLILFPLPVIGSHMGTWTNYGLGWNREVGGGEGLLGRILPSRMREGQGEPASHHLSEVWRLGLWQPASDQVHFRWEDTSQGACRTSLDLAAFNFTELSGKLHRKFIMILILLSMHSVCVCDTANWMLTAFTDLSIISLISKRWVRRQWSTHCSLPLWLHAKMKWRAEGIWGITAVLIHLCVSLLILSSLWGNHWYYCKSEVKEG